ncbi:MAG: fibronectin-binding autotransporter adhesin, partial [Anaerophaga sp.]|nr:fibronectin-binding autotransporter adhesin [Anaerophaga sp.]
MKKFYIVLVGLILGLITGVDAFAQQTWYALNSGEWNNPDNWTLDPAAAIYVTEDEGYPLEGDDVVIKSGRTINMPTEGDSFSAHCNVLTVDGRLDLKNTSGHNFSEIRGSGRIIMEGDNFPSGDASNFVGEGKGTVVYKGSGYDISDHTFYNVEIDLEGTDPKVNLAGDLTVNGNFSVLNGNFQFGNNNTTRTLTVKGNITVNNGASMTVNSANAAHNLYSRGNITNNGSIQFTNLSNPDYDSTPTDGYVILTVKGESNTVLTANNTTFLQRLILDKGSDRTYRFTVNPSQREYFRLFGQNDTVSEEKALYIKNGTLELTGATYIHSLTEGGDDFYVPETGGFWINGGAVEVNSTAVSNNADGFTSTGVEVNAVGSQSFSVLGKFRITDGTLNTHTHGFVAWDSGNALVQIEGGTVKTPGFRSAGNQEGRWTYNQSGGHVFMKGGIESDLDPQGKATFSIEGVNNVFIMTGGTMEIQDAATGNDLAIDIQSGEGKFNVTGGTIKINRIAGTSGEFNISSTAPFFNLEIAGVSNTATALLNSELTVLNDLIVRENGILDVTSNNYALNIGRNLFLCKSSSNLNLRSNITSFIGEGNSLVHDSAGVNISLHQLNIAKDNRTDKVILENGDLFISNHLDVVKGDLEIGNNTVSVSGNVSFKKGNVSTTTGGKLVLNGNSKQTLYSDYGHDYGFGAVELNNTGSIPQIELLSDITISSLNLATNQFIHIGEHNLKITESLTKASEVSWGLDSSMFRTNGLSSDGGLTLPIVFSGDKSDELVQTFPVGILDGNTTRYTPGEVFADGDNFSANGFVTMKPVNDYHPTVTDENIDYVLDYYWNADQEGLDDLEGNLRYNFVFDSDVNVDSYRFLFFTYNPEGIVFTRGVFATFGKNVLQNDERTFAFPYSTELSEDFTYGVFNADFIWFSLIDEPRTLYSRQNGDWDDRNTWSETGHDGNPVGNNEWPHAGDIVIIGNGHRVNVLADNNGGFSDYYAGEVIFEHDTIVSTGFEDIPRLQIARGNNMHLGKVSGTGMITQWINNERDPNIYGDLGDFSNQKYSWFLYIADGTDVVLPESPREYPNVATEGDGYELKFTKDITINGNLNPRGNSILLLNNGDEGDIEVKGDLVVGDWEQGTLKFPAGDNVRTLTVEGNVDFTSTAGGLTTPDENRKIIVEDDNGTAVHQFIVHGDIIQGDGVVDLFNQSGKPKVDLRFEGDGDSEFIRSGTEISDFYRIFVDKSKLENQVTFSSDFSLSGANNNSVKPLTLEKGTVILDHSALNIELSSGGGMYKIPAVSELIVNQGTVSLGGSDPNGAGLWLDGKLTINDGGKAQFDEGTNNYIEYTSSGKSEIEVNGSGELYVGSQIRRSPYTEAGILKFSQNSDASTIEIGTKDAGESTRGVFEILNTGSSFTQAAGAKLTIKNSKAGGFTDFYFDPESVSLGEGSTIEIAAGNEASEPFDMYVNQPLENLTFSGNVEGKLKTVPVEILGNLSIGTNSVFNTNGLDVTIHGDMTNEGSYNANENTTYFSGLAGQSITGNTEFYNLVKNEGTDTLRIGESSAVTIANDLTLNTGIFDTGENDVSVKGDFYIAGGAYTVSGSERNGVVLNGTSSQELSGGGTIARLMVDNAAGVVVPTQSSAITFSDVLKLNNGILDIGRNLLVLTENAVIEGDDSDSFSSSNMVQTNLSFTDAGIKKYFPADVVSNF